MCVLQVNEVMHRPLRANRLLGKVVPIASTNHGLAKRVGNQPVQPPIDSRGGRRGPRGQLLHQQLHRIELKKLVLNPCCNT